MQGMTVESIYLSECVMAVTMYVARVDGGLRQPRQERIDRPGRPSPSRRRAGEIGWVRVRKQRPPCNCCDFRPDSGRPRRQ
jgi:hypothetical protein